MNTPSFHLLTGRINPKDHLQQYKDTSHFLEAKTLENFLKLQVAAKTEINAQLEIISSYRDFSRQESIWNRKVSGDLKILDDNERVINPKNYSQEELITKIARFSAIPGASRHHWGTDIDIYDASQIKKAGMKEGMVTLEMDALEKVFSGVTSVEEVLRAIISEAEDS